jgi:hypothetical protein
MPQSRISPSFISSSFLFFLGITFVFASNAAGQEKSASLLYPSASLAAPFPSLTAFAKNEDVPLSGILPGEERDHPRAGDRITMLVTLSQESSTQQWIAIVNQDSLTNDEKALAPLPELVLYSSTGREMHFKNTRTALNVYFVGPFSVEGSVSAEKLRSQLHTPHRTLVSREQLNVGLDRYGRTALGMAERARNAGVNISDLYHIGTTSPLTEDQLNQGKKFIDLIHPTEEEERTVFSVSFALYAFLSSALKIPDFKEVVECVLEKPSLWSIVTKLGLHAFLKYDVSTVRTFDAGFLGVPKPAYAMPVQLFFNDELAVHATMVMTAARPPLQTCAGIVEVYAEHPTDPSKRLLIQLVAARK